MTYLLTIERTLQTTITIEADNIKEADKQYFAGVYDEALNIAELEQYNVIDENYTIN